jgi:hypothetical protein
LTYYREVIGKDYYSFEHKGYAFVVVNTQLWKAEVAKESAQHDSWFRQTLKSLHAKGLPVIIIGHYPLYLKTPDEKDEYFNLPLEKRNELLALFKKHGVIAMLGGHTHKTIINNYEGIHFVNAESTCRNFDKRPLGFRIWRVTSPKSLKHTFVPLNNIKNSSP